MTVNELSYNYDLNLSDGTSSATMSLRVQPHGGVIPEAVLDAAAQVFIQEVSTWMPVIDAYKLTESVEQVNFDWDGA